MKLLARLLNMFITHLRGLLLLLISAGLVAACSSDGDGSPTPISRVRSPAASAASATPAPTVTPVPVMTAIFEPPATDGYAAVETLPQLDLGQMLGIFLIPGDDGFAVLLTKEGLVRRVSMTDDSFEPTVYLDLRDRLIDNPFTEEGLLGLAFSPDFATNRQFYVYYTAGEPRRSVISRFLANGDAADGGSEQIIMEVAQPFANHNGGHLLFGPDGYLYIGLGDGGSGGDPRGHGQDTSTLLGSLLRIDVSGGGGGYAIPPDNPFAGGGGAPEIWAYGLRNPWRFAFDPVTQQLWLADVGQNALEEVDRIEKGGNYGWNIMEGDRCFSPRSDCPTAGLILPRAVYGRDDGCSVTGGFVYRGRALPELSGWFVYGDYCSGRVWAVNIADDSPAVQLMDSGRSIAAFAEDADRELYLVTFNQAIYRIERR